MFRLTQLLLPTMIVLFVSCSSEHGDTYAIKDFRSSLQPYLTKIVSTGIVMDYDSSLRYIATDNELAQLSKSEHPALRASAFREMLHRKSFDHFDITMNNLDDTAIILSDEGEFGIFPRTVSDDILYRAKWKTQKAKNETIAKVLTKHNYLASAYLILLKLDPQEKYYPYIKQMAIYPRLHAFEGHEVNFNNFEYALYGLAKFKKKEDVQIIKQLLMKNVWQLSYVSFQLIKEFPDTAYADILQSYYRRQFYQFSGQRRSGFSGYVCDRADPEDFIRALTVQENGRSAQLLDTMLSRLPLQTCMPDKNDIVNEVIMEIWTHPCPAYANLREKIKGKAEEISKTYLTSIPVGAHDQPTNTTEENIGWYP